MRAAAGKVRRTVLHLAPHPDDELIGAPATLMALRDSGWRILNLACGLGGPGEVGRRESELREACLRAGFELRIADVARSSALLEEALLEETLLEEVVAALDSQRPEILVAPSPQDLHPAHEMVGRVAVRACEGSAYGGTHLWLWGLWADLPFPTIAVAFGEERMREVLQCLEAHAGELERNDYRSLVQGRAQMNSSLGPERVFGFGSRAQPGEGVRYVELLCELLRVGAQWGLGALRWFDAEDPLGAAAAPGGNPRGKRVIRKGAIGDWLHGASASSL